ncbi:hypothetical protein [Sphingopyxis sp. KK2]|uniref:hypothetical protein n=1 Tax=Sphingopyxis sp. KK2 TaxID=1855727 RepID=UPI00097E5DF9|nr:hypothetical protein [Sphingopyxis sp. KK2]
MLDRIAWPILALIHLMPALAFFRPAMLTRLYAVTPQSPSFLLLHHRAALFLVVFTICVWAAFDPATRRIASVAAAISMVSFLALYWQAGSPPSLRTIALADLAGLPFLAIVAWRAFSPA